MKVLVTVLYSLGIFFFLYPNEMLPVPAVIVVTLKPLEGGVVEPVSPAPIVKV
jgi:hypothetical protein